MGYYNNNLACIKESKLYLHEKLMDFDRTKLSSKLDSVQSIETKDSNKTIVVKYENKTYRLNSSYYPIEEAKIWAEQYNIDSINMVISMFGFGNGMFARELMNKMKKGDMLVIYEPSTEVFLHVLENYDITDILKNNQVSISINEINSFEFHNIMMTSIKITNIQTQLYCLHPYYDTMFPNQYRDYLKELKDNNVQAIVSVNTSVSLGEKIINNSLMNLKHIKQSNAWLDFYDVFPKDIPAIVIAAGPSLKNDIDELKRAKGRAILFAVDRALDFLLDNGIEPDFVVTLDPVKPLEYFTTRESISIPLISVLEGAPEIFNFHSGRKIISNCNSFVGGLYESLKKPIPNLITGVSVATETFFACKQMEFEKIILVGQDLSYYGNETHISSIQDGEELGETFLVDSNNGGKVKTRYDWYRMIIWYQDVIECFPNLNVINATINGAKIKGTTIMPLNEVIDQYCTKKIDCDKLVRDKEITFTNDEIKQLNQLLKDSRDVLQKIKDKSKEAIDLCDKLLAEFDKNNFASYVEKDCINKLTKINKFIEEQKVNKLLDFYVTAHATNDLTDIYDFSEEEETNTKKTYKKARAVYQTTIDGVKFAEPILNELIEYLDTIV